MVMQQMQPWLMKTAPQLIRPCRLRRSHLSHLVAESAIIVTEPVSSSPQVILGSHLMEISEKLVGEFWELKSIHLKVANLRFPKMIIINPEGLSGTSKSLMLLMLGKTEGQRRRGWQRMRWLDNVIHAMNMNLGTLQEAVWRTGETGILWSMGPQKVVFDSHASLDFITCSFSVPPPPHTTSVCFSHPDPLFISIHCSYPYPSLYSTAHQIWAPQAPAACHRQHLTPLPPPGTCMTTMPTQLLGSMSRRPGKQGIGE
ncbi:hypothetical protein L345_05648, partial [Ophiophagus hannah]